MHYTELSFPENSLFLVTGGAHKKVLVDVKSMLDKKAFTEAGYLYWRL